jgi:hypothetical protein
LIEEEVDELTPSSSLEDSQYGERVKVSNAIKKGSGFEGLEVVI